jgi:hypothetical protein
MRRSSELNRGRPKRWAITLSVINVVLYVVLMAMSRTPRTEGIFKDYSIDFHTPLSLRVAIALDAPALFLAAALAQLVGKQEMGLIWILGVVPTIALWYFIGLWLDRFQMPARTTSRSAWREPNRLIGVVVLCGILLFAGWTWPRAFMSQASLDLSFEIVACLIIWPVFVGLVALRTIWRGAY